MAGIDDQLWPSAIMAKSLRENISRYGYEDRVEMQLYAGAGHAINPGLPSALTQVEAANGEEIMLGGSASANNAAQQDALQRILAAIEFPTCYESNSNFNQHPHVGSLSQQRLGIGAPSPDGTRAQF